MLCQLTYQRGSMPEYVVFDNNCSLSKHIKDNPAFKGIGLPVDVFHFKSKHSTGAKNTAIPPHFPILLGMMDNHGSSIHQLLSKQTCGLVGTSQCVGKWVQTFMIFSLTK